MKTREHIGENFFVGLAKSIAGVDPGGDPDWAGVREKGHPLAALIEAAGLPLAPFGWLIAVIIETAGGLVALAKCPVDRMSRKFPTSAGHEAA